MTSILKSSGSKQTIVVTHGTANSLASVRNVPISPMKGACNPPHIHIKNPLKKGK